jgi:hypothetical protein
MIRDVDLDVVENRIVDAEDPHPCDEAHALIVGLEVMSQTKAKKVSGKIAKKSVFIAGPPVPPDRDD